MEHDDLEREQRMRYQMGLPVLAKNAAHLGFENFRKGKEPTFTTRWETTAMTGTIVDTFRKAWEEHNDRQLLDCMTATIRKNVNRPVQLTDPEAVRTIMQDLERLREKEVQRMMCRSFYLRVVESEHVTKEVQARRHRKKRINKKWRKRYGMKRVPDLNTMVLYQEPSGEYVLLAHPKQVEKLRNQIRMDLNQNIRFDFSKQLHNKEE